MTSKALVLEAGGCPQRKRGYWLFYTCCFIFAACSSFLSSCQTDKETISLAGKWEVLPFEKSIQLPGTLDEAKLGSFNGDTAYGILSREYEFIGTATYGRNIRIPESWNGKEITLFLERVLWESKVYVDGELLSTHDALGTPHEHHLGRLSPGTHSLSVAVNNDMIHNIGDKGHAYGEYMQSIWNGMVGRIELQSNHPIHLAGVKTFTDLQSSSVDVQIACTNPNQQLVQYEVIIREEKSKRIVAKSCFEEKSGKFRKRIAFDTPIHVWNEFNPFLYEIDIQVSDEALLDQEVFTFGFCEVDRSQHHVLINGEPIFLRGNLDCIHFPLTGYPSTQVDDWRVIFQKYKDYGLNHVRFHSWCPPEAAFVAADELGIYIQAEASVWIDWWMGTDMIARGRPEMDTKGHPQGIGKGDEDADRFIRAEMKRVIDTYGNHPSFILFCIGNELGSSDFSVMGEWIKELKEYDPRRLYAASTARTITDFCDYSATHNVPTIGGVRQRLYNHKNWDYEDRYSLAQVPIIAHEIGQWPVYPDWNETEKYTGVLKPRYLEKLKKLAAQNGLVDQNLAFTQASGKLSALLYKDEIESFMRTPSCAGYQLLSMQDYIGQGEAVIGWLDSFYDSKGTLSPETARQYMAPVVPLLALPSHTWMSEDTVTSKVFLHQFGQTDLIDQKITWSLTNGNHTLYTQNLEPKTYQRGKLHSVGEIKIPLPNTDKAQQYTLTLHLEPSNSASARGRLQKPETILNSWPIWVYPRQLAEEPDNISIVDQFDQSTIDKLTQGAKVLLLAHRIGNPDYVVNAAWKPLYWSASFFPGQSIETLGAVIQSDHPALAEFPTPDYYAWNWWSICQGPMGFDLSEAPVGLDPIVQPISDFHFARRLGSLFEVRVGQGKLMVSGYKLDGERLLLPEARQLRHSLLNYMASADFQPQREVSIDFLNRLFSSNEVAITVNETQLQGAQLVVEAGSNMTTSGNSQWSHEADVVVVQKNTGYSVKADGCWKDMIGTAWFGKEMTLQIDLPDGTIGQVFLFVHDWNNLDRKGSINIENREYAIGSHGGQGKWIALDFMREDTQDGELLLKVHCQNGPNIMISRMALKYE